MPPAKDVCLLCRLSCYSSSKKRLTAFTKIWVPQRRMATAMTERRRPARMTLSEDVVVGNRRDSPRQTPSMRDDNPFGGMNRTSPNLRTRDLERARSRLQAATVDNKGMSAGAKERVDRKSRPLYKALKMQTTLSPVSYSQREAISQKIASLDKFEKFPLLPAICDAVYTQAFPGMDDIRPTPIQRLAIPALVTLETPKSTTIKQPKAPGERPKYKSLLLAAETGSGKTLAYLLPIIDSIKRQEVLDREEDAEKQVREASERAKRGNPYELDSPELELSNSPHSTMGRPRAMIVLPTSELVTQVGAVAKLISHPIKYRSAPISSIYTPTVIRNRLFNRAGIDLIITTPHLISSIGENDPNIFSRVKNLVIDEADSLLDRSFAPITSSIIDKCAPSLKNLILCSATIPKSLDSFLDKRFPDIKRLVTPKLHSIPRRVQLGVIDIDKDPYRGNRSLACADVIWSIGKAVHEDLSPFHTVKSMLVFVNEREKASEIASFLSSKGIDAVALTRDTSESRQREILSTFTAVERQDGEVKQLASSFIPFDQLSNDTPASGGKNHLANVKVLVTTDLGSRGIDTLAVRHVILYDVPHTTIDFIHRLGRTGRMGRRGRGIVLVGKHDRKDIVREVREAMFKGQTLV